MRFIVSGLPFRDLLLEPLFLIDRIVQLRIGIGDFLTANKQLETFHETGVIGFLLRKRRQLQRIINDEGRLDQFRLHKGIEQFCQHLCGGVFFLKMNFILQRKSNRFFRICHRFLRHASNLR